MIAITALIVILGNACSNHQFFIGSVGWDIFRWEEAVSDIFAGKVKRWAKQCKTNEGEGDTINKNGRHCKQSCRRNRACEEEDGTSRLEGDGAWGS